MKHEKRHVGRPTNEELKIRRNKKLLNIFVPIILVIVVLAAIGGLIVKNNNNANSLKAATNGYGGAINVSALNSQVTQKNCYIVIPLKIKNTTDKNITINRIKLKYPGYGNKDIQSGSVNWTISKNSTVTKYPQFNMKNIDSTTKKLEIILYFNNTAGNTIYVPETLTLGSMWYDRISKCKTTTKKTTTKKTTTKKTTTKKTTTKKTTTKKTTTKKTTTKKTTTKKTTTKKTTTINNTKKKTNTSGITSNEIKTYSMVKEGNEPNSCDIRILSLTGNKLKYQVRCQANARPMTVRLKSNGKETIILKDFNMHKGYIGTHTYSAPENILKDAVLNLYYKKQYIVEKKDDKQYKDSENVYVNGKLNKKSEIAVSNSKNIPSDKCTISVSNVSTKSFNWTIKCDSGAKPKSVRLETKVNEKDGSQVAMLRKNYNNNYGITESKKANISLKSNTNYTAVLYFGTKQYGYYRTEVSFKTN